MKKGCLITILILMGLVGWFFYAISTTFDPEYDKVEIKQNIGGVLICNSVYIPDIQSDQYNISYQYKSQSNQLIDIGNGTYYDREWKKDEQLIQYKNWTILKTGGWAGTDKVIIGNVKTGNWLEYEFTPESIEKDSVWKASKVKSLLNYCCSEAFVDQITNGKIILHYKFRIIEKQADLYDQRKIYYQIDELTGQPKMVRVQ